MLGLMLAVSCLTIPSEEHGFVGVESVRLPSYACENNDYEHAQ
jgi:hypothetical protein